MKDETEHRIVNLLINEIFPRFGEPVELVTDNEPENVNEVMNHA